MNQRLAAELARTVGCRRNLLLLLASHYARIIVVNIISRRTLKEFAAAHADAAKELDHWFAIARKAKWQNFLEVRQDFTDADQYNSLLIFNIRHNTYRLIVKVDYRAKLLMVKAFLTHREYDREDWKKWAR